MDSTLSDWRDFFTAEVGGSAALAGLVIVAVSINLGPILKIKSLPGRAVESLIYLGGAMIAASLALIPQPEAWCGVELAVLGGALWATTLRIQIGAMRDRSEKTPGLARRFVFGQLCTLPAIAAGALFIAGVAWAPFVLAAGILIALAIGLINTWVLLVEILR